MSKNQPVLERFFEKVDKNGPNGCWNFTSSIAKSGHGKFFLNGKCQQAYRVAYEFLVGPIPEGLDLHHSCENPACVNPNHLKPLTQKEHCLSHPNHLAYINSQKTHCLHGHPLEEWNLVKSRNGRVCLTCNRKRIRLCQAKRMQRIKNLKTIQ